MERNEVWVYNYYIDYLQEGLHLLSKGYTRTSSRYTHYEMNYNDRTFGARVAIIDEIAAVYENDKNIITIVGVKR